MSIPANQSKAHTPSYEDRMCDVEGLDLSVCTVGLLYYMGSAALRGIRLRCSLY